MHATNSIPPFCELRVTIGLMLPNRRQQYYRLCAEPISLQNCSLNRNWNWRGVPSPV